MHLHCLIKTLIIATMIIIIIIIILSTNSSDQMGNKGAFIVLNEDLKPNYTTYEAVVRMIELINQWYRITIRNYLCYSLAESIMYIHVQCNIIN